MKIIRKLLLVLASFVALLLIIALFVPKEWKAESEITINKPASEVFNYIKLVKNQDNYGVWQLSDPNQKITEEGTDGTVGYKYSWNGEKTGKGSQTITQVIEGSGIHSSLDFGMGEPAKCTLLVSEKSPSESTVKWQIFGTSPYPLNIMNLVFDMKKDFDQGLLNLKNLLEKQ